MRAIGFTPFALLLALLLAAPALAADPVEGYPYLGKITGSEVRLRSGPSLGHRVLDLASSGEQLVVTGKEQSWLRVKVPGGMPCWIREDLLTVRGDEAIVAKTRVLMRPTAGQDYLPLEGRLEANEKLRILESKTPAGEKLKWYRVLAPERVPAFVHSDFVTRVGPVPADTAAIAKKRMARMVTAAKSEGKADTAARRDDALRARVRKVREKLEKIAAAPGGASALGDLKRELHRVLTEADFRVTKLEAAGLYKDIVLLEKSRQLERARKEAALTEEQLKKAIRDADAKYDEAMARLRQIAPLKEMQFTEVGWVHLRKGAWILEKGGIPLCVLTSKLFQMKDFAGKKVGVRGPRVGEDPERGVRILDVEAVEIFN